MNIELKCPRCDSDNLARDGKKSDGPQSQSPRQSREFTILIRSGVRA